MIGDQRPIGIMDSGVGGLTVANAILEHCPSESILYFGDTAHLPYGDKSRESITHYALDIVKFLIEQNCKCVIIACNTAWTVAGKTLQEHYGWRLPIYSVVEPLVELVRLGQHKQVGLIATRATVETGVYRQRISSLRPTVALRCMATPLLVPMVEEGYADKPMGKAVLDGYFLNHALGEIDALILACTHYPILGNAIAEYFPKETAILEPSAITAEHIKQRLMDLNLSAPSDNLPRHRYIVSDNTPGFSEVAGKFFKHELEIEVCAL